MFTSDNALKIKDSASILLRPLTKKFASLKIASSGVTRSLDDATTYEAFLEELASILNNSESLF